MLFLIFAIPSMLLILFGVLAGNYWRLFIGVGIALYGLCYFLVHDVFIHQRLPWLKRSDNVYLRAIRKAHKVHNKHLGKGQGEFFCMLPVPMEDFRTAKRAVA